MLLLAMLAACEQEPTDPIVPAGIEAISGDGQAARVTATLPEPLAVRVLDDGGRPMPEITVTWRTEPGTGSIEPLSHRTDADGTARARWTLGTAAGTRTARASVGALMATFTATASPGPTEEIELDPERVRVSPDSSVTLAATARDAHGNLVPADSIVWASLDTTVATVTPAGVVTATGGGRVHLTATAGEAADTAEVLVFNPLTTEGNVAFEMDLERIRVHDPDRETRPVILDLFYPCYDPEWHPSGEWLVAACFSYDRWEPTIQRIWSDGWFDRLVTAEDVAADSGQSLLEPHLADNGNALFFRSTGPAALWRASADGRDPVKLLELDTDASILAYSPSPTADRLAIIRATPSDTSLLITELDSGTARDLELDARTVAWSPDGERLAVVADSQVGLVRPDGSGFEPFVNGPRGPDNLAWTPDGDITGDFLNAWSPGPYGPQLNRRAFVLDPADGSWWTAQVDPTPGSSKNWADVRNPTWRR